jgi:hypothetical protein
MPSTTFNLTSAQGVIEHYSIVARAYLGGEPISRRWQRYRDARQGDQSARIDAIKSRRPTLAISEFWEC